MIERQSLAYSYVKNLIKDRYLVIKEKKKLGRIFGRFNKNDKKLDDECLKDKKRENVEKWKKYEVINMVIGNHEESDNEENVKKKAKRNTEEEDN
ncbi:hypothetical protein RFI_03224 [Reticulomyxa filosa]|uniref:Uncharacterized protein n=1 Tax=Reticulomyxa filosa TaxID=46433 RepID=X6P706_RETFI|nr:hypothetical protein RFI_03224 [Reticulomyxa filosa]|eukprot:ETO33873.1 hypothetical protein RFI_03224 [Reticulomyxa filosa]